LPPAEIHPLRRLQLVFATGFGLGYAPIASGTFGSLPGLLIYWGLYTVYGTPAVLVGLVAVIAAGVVCATAGEQHFGRHDPGQVVVDEIAGQMVALLFLAPTPAILVAGFLLFRLMDILKPLGARRLEALPRGWGIMADDLAAGVYANLVLQVLAYFFPDLLGVR